jgi:hypothetical protein
VWGIDLVGVREVSGKGFYVTDVKVEHVVVELGCSGCGLRWHRRLGIGSFDLVDLASSEEVEHHLGSRCAGSVTGREVGYHSGYVESELHRCAVDVGRYEDFLAGNLAAVESRALLLDRPVGAVAAAMFVERELRVERERASSPGDVVLGLGCSRVKGCSSVNVNVAPYVVFRPERLEVPPEVAEAFLLTDIKVGKNSQLWSPGAVPLSVFLDRRHQYLRLRMDVAQLNMFVTVSVTNATGVDRNFTGALVGVGVGDDLCR